MREPRNHQNSRRLSIGFVAGVVSAILVTGGVVAWWAFRNLTTSQTSTSTPTEPSPQDPNLEVRSQVYWLNTSGDRLKLQAIPLKMPQSADERQAIQTALEKLLAGPTNSNDTTTIPPGTKLLNLKLEKDGIHLDLSEEFSTGGGSASMSGRLAQLLYTATSNDANAHVWINVAGEPLEVLGGEGLIVEQPMTRAWFEENYEL